MARYGEFKNFEDNVYYFKYANPKTKERLRVWDRQPIIVVVYMTTKHIIGINLHWLPFFRLPLFLYIFKRLQKALSTTINGHRKLLRLTYGLLKNDIRFERTQYKKAIRKYLIRRITNVKEIPIKDIGVFAATFRHRKDIRKGGRR